MLEIKRPVSAPLSPEQAAAIQEIVARHKAVKGGLLPAMHEVQGLCGNWLPMEALQLISQGMDVPYPYLYGVMSFYTMFSPTPRGKFIIRFCESPPCHIWGADDLVEVAKAELGLKHVGDTTADGLFTLEHTACLGVCEISPAMQINEVVFGRLTPERLKNILSDYRAGKTVDYKTLPRTTNALSDYTASGDELVLLANVDQIDPLSLDAYLERGGYDGLKKALGMSQVEVVNTVKDVGPARPGRRRFPHRLEVVLHPAQPEHAQIHRLQRRRRRARDHQRPLHHGRRPPPGFGRHGHCRLCGGRQLRLYLRTGRVLPLHVPPQ